MGMTKTPEELAEELDRQAVLYVSLKARNDVSYYVGMRCYKAGYQAAKEHAHAALEEAEARIQELEDQVADGSKVMNEFDAMLEEKELVDIKLRDAFYRSLNFLTCNESVPVFRLNDIRSYVGHLEDVLMARNTSEKPDGSNSLNNSNGWISVKDRLPDIPENGYSNRVLLLRADKFIVIAKIERCVRFVRPLQQALIVETDNGDPIEEFTHWMPLPKPPTE
jgi:uncharacterized coiled-coil protein SlyX